MKHNSINTCICSIYLFIASKESTEPEVHTRKAEVIYVFALLSPSLLTVMKCLCDMTRGMVCYAVLGLSEINLGRALFMM